MGEKQTGSPEGGKVLKATQSMYLAAATLLTLGLVACGGGSTPRRADPTPAPTPEPPVQGVPTTLTVSVRNFLGEPLASTSFSMQLVVAGIAGDPSQVTSDASGKIIVQRNFPDDVVAYVTGDGFSGGGAAVRVAADRLDADLLLEPDGYEIPALSNVAVTAASSDGRELDFTARLFLLQGTPWAPVESEYIDAVSILPCAPSTDEPCAELPGDVHASYEAVAGPMVATGIHPLDDPLAIALLIDQGSSIITDDPKDRRLFGAKFLQSRLGAGDGAAIAAFAADDGVTGQPAFLPETPLSVFPAGSLQFSADPGDLFGTIDSLASLEGGASPRHAAISELLDVVVSTAPSSSRRAVAVLASGSPDECTPARDCRDQIQAILDKSAATGTQLIVMGMADDAGRFDRRTLAPLAQSPNSTIIWYYGPYLLPTVMGRIPDLVAQRLGGTDLAFHLTSPQPGAFASGNLVSGNLTVTVCPWDCNLDLHVPFVFRVP
jgi:hypothetical protein